MKSSFRHRPRPYSGLVRIIAGLGLLTALAINAGAVYYFSTLAGTAPGSVDGTGSQARFRSPLGIAVDGAGNVFVADSGNHTIRKVTPAGVVTTVAGNPHQQGISDGPGLNALFYTPAGLAMDGSGNLYVSDSLAGTIRKITPTGVVTTLAGTPSFVGNSIFEGNPLEPDFFYPLGLAVDGAGSVYVADSDSNSVKKVTAAGNVSTLFYSGTFDPNAWAQLTATTSPSGIAVDGQGNLFVAHDASIISKIAPDGARTTVANPANADVRIWSVNDGSGQTYYALSTGFNGLALDSAGNLFTADNLNATLRKITPRVFCFEGHFEEMTRRQAPGRE